MHAELAASGFIAGSWLFSLDAVCLPTSVGSPLYGQPAHMDGFYWTFWLLGNPERLWRSNFGRHCATFRQGIRRKLSKNMIQPFQFSQVNFPSVKPGPHDAIDRDDLNKIKVFLC
jgi:hypothetical protein